MIGRPCFTVDVEDFSDGMRTLGFSVRGGKGIHLDDLQKTLAALPHPDTARLTFFVVGKFAPGCRKHLVELAQAGHEIASHGPTHGHLPDDPRELEAWLRTGREILEDVVQQPVHGFRTPRFDSPRTVTLERFRDLLAAAGFTYVSDERTAVDPHPDVIDLPVTRAAGLRLGGGSYQRFLPGPVVHSVLSRSRPPVVLYYHSYDFSPDAVPSVWSARSIGELRQQVLRRRIPSVFLDLLQRFGSRSCYEVTSEIRSVL